MPQTYIPSPLWEASGAEKGARVRGMFDDIAPTYDRINRLMTLGQDRRWRAIAVRMLNLKPGDTVADICSGTGDFLPILRKAVGDTGAVAGVDFSAAMLAESARKNPGARLIQADAMDLPFADRVFEGVTVGWGIRNVPDIDRAHAEIFRILQPGGRFVSIDMALPRSRSLRFASRFVTRRICPVLGRISGAPDAYRYLPESTDRFWDRDQLAQSMRRAGFADVAYRDLWAGNICIHFGIRPR